jgi:hypothetical protein
MVNVKILSYKSPQRYAVNRTIRAAQNALRKTHPDFEMTVTEVKTLDEMFAYTQVAILPSLVINEKLICVGRFPKKEEVINWLQEVLEPQP